PARPRQRRGPAPEAEQHQVTDPPPRRNRPERPSRPPVADPERRPTRRAQLNPVPAPVRAELPRTRQVRIANARNADEILEAVGQTERAVRHGPRPPRLVAEPTPLASVSEPLPPVLEPSPLEAAHVAPEPVGAGRFQHAHVRLGPDDDRGLDLPLERRG